MTTNGRGVAVFAFVLMMAWSAIAQPYETTLKRCLDNFKAGLGDFSPQHVEQEMQRRQTVLNECMQGVKFPDFELHNLDGTKFSSKSLAGKVVVINFWMTKSPAAVAVIPLLNDLVREYENQEVAIVSFANESKAALHTFLESHSVHYPIFPKSRDLINHQFGIVLGYPTNIVLNKKGAIVDYRVGASTKPEELTKLKVNMKKVIDGTLGESP